MDNPKNKTVLSLCTGYGGLERGIEAVIGECTGLAYVEVEAFAVTNLVNKMETGALDPVPIWTDLKTFDAKPFRGCVDILTAGFPCQPFSNAGTKNGTEDPRHLWPYIETTILLCKPSTVFLENVDGIISTKTIHHRPELCEYSEQAERRLGKTWGAFTRSRLTKYFGISVLKYVKWRLERLGYRCESGIFSASEVGAPHQRKRVFIMANSRSCGGELPRAQQSKKFNIDVEEQPKLGNSQSDNERRLPFPAMHREGFEIGGSSWGPGWPSRPGEPQHEWEEPRIVADS